MERPRIVIVGGGAAGFFAAITCAEANPAAAVTIHEATAHPLAKVRVSGGGRCNVTHACFEPRELAVHYPRGGRELVGPFHRWGPRETAAWFEARGVALKTEADGRMFPVTDNSATVVTCLREAAAHAGVQLVIRSGVKSAARAAGRHGFTIMLAGGPVECDRLLLATGGGRDSAGLAIARQLGHVIEPPAPSLFTFHVKDPRLDGLAGVSAGLAGVSIAGRRLRAAGPLLITHWGVSGPAILKLSAWGARELHAAAYRATLIVNWAEPRTTEAAGVELAALRAALPRRQVGTDNPFGLPARLWERLAAAADIAPDAAWATISNAALQALATQVTAGEFAIQGKSLNKEEFVTCGGVRLREVDFRTMASLVCPDLYFAGEVLDIDGLTGGFNFQSAWTTGRLAGLALATD